MNGERPDLGAVGKNGVISLDADMPVSISCPSPGLNARGLCEVNMLENEGQRKQSLKRGLIELEDELDIGNEKKERLMITKMSLIKRIIIPDV